MTTTINASTSSGLVVTPDNSGNIQLQYNGQSAPAFYAYPTTTTTLTAAADVKITLDAELFDTNNNFASSRFTPTVAGYYQVNGAITVNYWAGVILYCSIFKNGSYYATGNSGYPQTTGGVHVNVSSVVYMNGTTDYIELYGFNYAATTSNVTVANNSAYTYFNGCLLRGA